MRDEGFYSKEEVLRMEKQIRHLREAGFDPWDIGKRTFDLMGEPNMNPCFLFRLNVVYNREMKKLKNGR